MSENMVLIVKIICNDFGLMFKKPLTIANLSWSKYVKKKAVLKKEITLQRLATFV